MFNIKNFFVILVMMLSSSVYSMSINYGYALAFNANVNTQKYINNGFLFGVFNVDVDVNTLSGNGTIKSRNINIKCSDESNFNGSITASNECNIKVKKLNENGTIKGDNITIECEEFKFNGTISCATKCTIYAKYAFDESMFKKEGDGSFTVIINSAEQKN